MGRLPLLLLLERLASALGDPLVTYYRPPQQTSVQNDAKTKLVANAYDQSLAAKQWVWNYLNNQVRPALQDNWLGQRSTDELLERLDWEFKHMPLIHNGPLDASDTPTIDDDTDLATNMANGYLQNVCQRWVLGTPAETEHNLLGEHNIMTKFMNLPQFAKGPKLPTMREANNCVMYLATNLLKTHCGNFIYGSVTYVVNNLYSDKFALAPFDTGTFWENHQSQMIFGTLQDYYHVFKAHIETLNYNFADVFKRWYLEMPPPNIGDFPYLEVNWFGNAWFPESILYVIVKFSNSGNAAGMWGTDAGWTLQNNMRYRGRPVIWADGDDSGMLIDGTVNMIEGGRLGQSDSDYFTSNWNTNPDWQDFYNRSPEHLKFFLPQYDRRQICEEVEKNTGYMVMGHDRLGNCVYWGWDSFPSKWECLNDGSCEQTTSDKAFYNSQQECWQNCAQSKWSCVVTGDREGAHHCQPNPNGGACSDVDTCEAQCSQTFACLASSALGNASAASWAAQTFV